MVIEILFYPKQLKAEMGKGGINRHFYWSRAQTASATNQQSSIINPNAPVFQIKNIVLNAPCNRSVSPPPVNLCPASHENIYLPKTALS